MFRQSGAPFLRPDLEQQETESELISEGEYALKYAIELIKNEEVKELKNLHKEQLNKLEASLKESKKIGGDLGKQITQISKQLKKQKDHCQKLLDQSFRNQNLIYSLRKQMLQVKGNFNTQLQQKQQTIKELTQQLNSKRQLSHFMGIENESIGQERNDLAQEFLETVKKLWDLSVRGHKEERNNSKDKSKK